MTSIRHMAEQAVLRELCRVSANKTLSVLDPDLHQTRVLTGLLRGMWFSMPQLERAAFALGTYERHIVNTMTEHIRPGMTVYDVGANAGYLSLVLARIVGSEGRVCAFEPDPQNAKALQANTRNNGLANVSIIRKAVSDLTGIVTFASFSYSLVGHIAHEETPGDATLIQVEAVSLDDFVFTQMQPKPDFIKIDVEGGEEQVLRGAERLLREARPLILAEVRAGENWERVSGYMSSLDYSYQFVKGGWQLEKHQLCDVLFYPRGSCGDLRAQDTGH